MTNLKTHTSPDGWERIEIVDVEMIRDEYGEITDAWVFVTTTRSDVFIRTIKHSESPAQVADYYRKRGWTDTDCCFCEPRQAR
jgi:hypothetical protein